MKLDEIVGRYVALRDKKEEIAKQQKEALRPYNDALEKIEAALLNYFNQSGSDSCKTPAGTAFTSTRSSATVADREAFFGWVLEHNALDMLEARCAKLAVEQYLDSTGELPPGVNRRVEKIVCIHRPKNEH
jgi:hypothetical protein